MSEAATLRAKADALEARANDIRAKAQEAHRQELAATPLNERLRYAAHDRCDCGAGMAYDPASPGSASSPFKGPSKWECSDVLRHPTYDAEQRQAAEAATHTPPLPFAFYEIKSEGRPSANGATTRVRVS